MISPLQMIYDPYGLPWLCIVQQFPFKKLEHINPAEIQSHGRLIMFQIQILRYATDKSHQVLFIGMLVVGSSLKPRRGWNPPI